MTAGIFLIRDDSELVELTASAYDSEALLQGLLERYPNLLAGDQMDASAPRRWLLVSREAAVPAEAEGPGRWSLDHLFLDQDGIPTLIEVKRSSDSRIRREVVGQMLDYAANGVAYWPVETVRSMFEARVEREKRDPSEVLSLFIGQDGDSEEFWQRVKTNLLAGRIRMVFVADEIPPELRRVVEFLNTQMDPAEVLAVEVKQYIGGRFRGLVPRLLGQTEQGLRKKAAGIGSTSGGREWNEESFTAELRSKFGEVEVEIARRLLTWAQRLNLTFWWGKGVPGSVYFGFPGKQKPIYPFAVRTNGRIMIQLGGLMRFPSFEHEDARRELQRKLNAIPDVQIADDSLSKYPTFPLAAIQSPTEFEQFTAAMNWAGETARIGL